jgi:hypothetical protein
VNGRGGGKVEAECVEEFVERLENFSESWGGI